MLIIIDRPSCDRSDLDHSATSNTAMLLIKRKGTQEEQGIVKKREILLLQKGDFWFPSKLSSSVIPRYSPYANVIAMAETSMNLASSSRLNMMDRLRELGISHFVALPQVRVTPKPIFKTQC